MIRMDAAGEENRSALWGASSRSDRAADPGRLFHLLLHHSANGGRLPRSDAAVEASSAKVRR